MAFVIQGSVRAQKEVKRVARERLDRALNKLEGLEAKSPAEIEDAVHDVRKRCKEVRALARLVREPLGDEWSRFNTTVRDASNELSSIRDAHAVLATLDDLLEAGRRTDDTDLQTVRSGLAQVADQATLGIRGSDQRIGSATDLLIEARHDVRRWKIDDDSAWLTSGLAATYRRGQRGLRRAQKKPDDGRMHEWRKSVKTLWYQVRLLKTSAPSVLLPLVAALDDLAEALGDDHDLSVLIERIEADPRSFGGKKRVGKAVRLARSQQDDLRRRAFRLGASLYAEDAEAFVTRIDRYRKAALSLGPELATGGIAELIADERRAESDNRRSAGSVERERKFLVSVFPESPGDGTVFRQGYLAIDGTVSVRVRDAAQDGCTLTAKAGRGAVRTELEWPISRDQFDAVWPRTEGRRIHKTRYRLALHEPCQGAASLTVEVDRFHDELEGLVIAEVEFESSDVMSAFTPPEWFGHEVTDDVSYANAALAEYAGRSADRSA